MKVGPNWQKETKEKNKYGRKNWKEEKWTQRNGEENRKGLKEGNMGRVGSIKWCRVGEVEMKELEEVFALSFKKVHNIDVAE